MASQDIQSSLYNGGHKVLFKNSSHRYYIDGEAKPGVTTIMSKVLAKPELMLWPLNTALSYLESRFPTITLSDIEVARRAHIEKRDAGGNVGTIVHGLAEKLLLGELSSEDLFNQPAEVNLALGGFTAWCDIQAPKVIAVEQVVYSQEDNYAGTFDSVLQLDGRTYLCDLKTSNPSREAPKGIYAENFIQLGGYLRAYNEQREYELAHGGTQLVGIDDLMVISCKKDGRVDTLTASSLLLSPVDCIKLWDCTLALFKNITNIKKQLIGATA